MENNGESLDDKLSNELIGHLNDTPSYNQDLGTEKDPRYDSYKEFLKQIGGGGEPPES